MELLRDWLQTVQDWWGTLGWTPTGAALTTAVAVLVGILTVRKHTRELSARSRARAQLAIEVDIWTKMPKGPSRRAMRQQIDQTTERLLYLENPVRRWSVRLSGVLVLAVLAGAGFALYLAYKEIQPTRFELICIAILAVLYGAGRWVVQHTTLVERLLAKWPELRRWS